MIIVRLSMEEEAIPEQYWTGGRTPWRTNLALAQSFHTSTGALRAIADWYIGNSNLPAERIMMILASAEFVEVGTLTGKVV